MSKPRQKTSSTSVTEDIGTELSPALLQELGLLTREGHLNADARRKIKQIQHLYQFLKSDLEELAQKSSVDLVDVGAGKSYLAFLLWDLHFKNLEQGDLYSVEIRKELVNRSQEIAAKINCTNRMKFCEATIESASSSTDLPEKITAVTALHACDTATDDAILFALKKKAEFIALVPCCQAEVAAQLENTPHIKEVWPLWRRPIHRREFGSHLTNVIRALYLESHGYKVTVTELTGWEHSLKNELILARKIQGKNPVAQKQLDELLAKIPVRPKLLST